MSTGYQLEIGAKGALFGSEQTVVGRARLSVRDGLSRSSWWEYYLSDQSGKNCILVFEVEERGPGWKYFRLEETSATLTAAEFDYKGPGDRLQVDGRSYGITYRNDSRVDRAEGNCPEGITVGASANFVNAADVGNLLVVSWTGSELEYYFGRRLAQGTVERAFGLPVSEYREVPTFRSSSAGGGSAWLTWDGIKAWTVPGLFLLFIFFTYAEPFLDTDDGPRPAPRLVYYEGPSVALGAKGTLAGRLLEVVGVWDEEWRTDGLRAVRREFVLKDSSGHYFTLLNGLDGNKFDWALLETRPLERSISPLVAGALLKGAPVRLESQEYTVGALFQVVTRSGRGVPPPLVDTNGTLYSATGWRDNKRWLLRWHERAISLVIGQTVSEADLRALR